MRILLYLLEIAFLYGLFQIGRGMVVHQERWARYLAHDERRSTRLRSFFLYGGRIFEWLALIWGFLDVVAILILATGYLSDLALGM